MENGSKEAREIEDTGRGLGHHLVAYPPRSVSSREVVANLLEVATTCMNDNRRVEANQAKLFSLGMGGGRGEERGNEGLPLQEYYSFREEKTGRLRKEGTRRADKRIQIKPRTR